MTTAKLFTVLSALWTIITVAGPWVLELLG